MSTTDYLIDIALILIILLRIKEQPLTRHKLVRPFIFVGIAIAVYLDGVPTAGNDLPLILTFALVGAAIGSLSGLTMRFRRGPSGEALASAGPAAVFFWVLGMGARMAFIIWETHSGAGTVTRFSVEHHITSAEAWTAAILAMAVAEICFATILQVVRARRVGTIEGLSDPHPSATLAS